MSSGKLPDQAASQHQEAFDSLACVSGHSCVSNLLVGVLSPADLLVTDPQGRRSGYDSATGTVVNEIPGAVYTGRGTEPQYVAIIGNSFGSHLVTLTGTGAGIYRLIEQQQIGPSVQGSGRAGSITLGQRQWAMVLVAPNSSPVLLPDTTPPATTVAASSAPNAAGWYKAELSVTLSGVDTASGVAKTEYSLDGGAWALYGGPISIGTEGAHTLQYRSIDNAGNTEQAKTLSVKIDKTSPTVNCGSPDGIWHKDDASIICTASDTGSNLANAADASFALTTNVVVGTEDSNSSTNNRQVCDVAGNCTTAGPIAGNKVDKKAPAITVTVPAANAVYILGQVVSATYTCSDGGSGSDTCTGPIPTGSALDTATVGSKTFKVDAKDKVGNPSSQTVTYSVQYASSGTCQGEPGHEILQPINADGTSVFKQGSTIPTKFRVCDAKGTSIGTAGVVQEFKLVKTDTGTAVQQVNEPVDSRTPDNAFRWDPSAQQWIFNIDTKSLAANTTYAYRIALNDGTTIDFKLGLR